MVVRLQDEIKQTRPFASIEAEVFLNVVRTAEELMFQFAALFREQGLSFSQYNVLRILRGSPQGLSCGEISERMVTQDSDMTRLLDGLVKQSLVTRKRSVDDRRVVLTKISPRGRALVRKLDPPTLQLASERLGHMTKADLKRLSALLEEARAKPE